MARVWASGAEACFDVGVQAQSATTAKAVARPARRHLSKSWRIWSSLSLKPSRTLALKGDPGRGLGRKPAKR